MSDTQISDFCAPEREYENTSFPAKNPGAPRVRSTATSQAFIRASVSVAPVQVCSKVVPPFIDAFTAFAPALPNANVNCARAGAEIM